MFITQITVYLENARGTLRALTKVLAENGIDMLALSVADTASFGLVRIVVREGDFDRAFSCLQENGFMARLNHVFCIAVPHHPAGLDGVLKIIGDNDISIEYMYSFNYNIEGAALMIMRLSKDRGAKGHEARQKDREQIAGILSENGVEMISQEIVNKL